MAETNNLTDTTLPDAPQLSAADGSAAVDNTLSLAELNQHLGKDFKDKSTALKALADTQSYVGKKLEAANPAPAPADDSLKAEVQSLKEEAFYLANPQYKDMRDIIKTMGNNPSEVVELAAFKSVFEKVKVADEVTSKKSVVSSNARLGTTSNYTDEAIKVANATGSVGTVSEILAKGIAEEFGMN